MFSPFDFYTKGLEVPKDVYFNEPLSEINENYGDNNLDFQLFNSFQHGELYIRAFEYTKDDELSKDKLKDRTLTKIIKSDSIQFFSIDWNKN